MAAAAGLVRGEGAPPLRTSCGCAVLQLQLQLLAADRYRCVRRLGPQHRRRRQPQQLRLPRHRTTRSPRTTTRHSASPIVVLALVPAATCSVAHLLHLHPRPHLRLRLLRLQLLQARTVGPSTLEEPRRLKSLAQPQQLRRPQCRTTRSRRTTTTRRSASPKMVLLDELAAGLQEKSASVRPRAVTRASLLPSIAL